MNKAVLTPIEVAEILKISKGTVYEMVKRGAINSYRVGNKVRIDANDLEEYKNKNMKLSNNKQNSLIFKNFNIESDAVCQREEMKKKHDFIICGQDIMLDILARHLQHYTKRVQALRTYSGSYNGLYELYHGKANLATVHLWDGETGEYNVPFVKRMLPGVPVVIIHLAKILQGIYVLKGNPKGIKGIEDLKRDDLTIINREIGSGTRILLDEYLRKLDIDRQKIKGYERECISHHTVANTVAKGGADLALGNIKVAKQVKGIEFIPLQYSNYELVIKKEDITKTKFQAVLEIIRSEEFKWELEGIGGYDLKDLGKITAEL
ncbi:MAG: substrate-binding domain-containing protein [Clostridiaceae bacterium]